MRTTHEAWAFPHLILHLPTEPVAQPGEIPALPELLGDTRAFSCTPGNAVPFSEAFLHMERECCPIQGCQGAPLHLPGLKTLPQGWPAKPENPLRDALSREKALLEHPEEWDGHCEGSLRPLGMW